VARGLDLRVEPGRPAGAFWRVAVAAGALCTVLTVAWAFTPTKPFWPGWVWFGLSVPLAYYWAIRRGLRAEQRRAFALQFAFSLVTALMLIWIWLMSPARFFWPVWPIGALVVLLVVHALVATAPPAARERQLRERVEQVTESRNLVLDAQAAEIRRLERDLHDGAQARLVSLGMSLGLAEELWDEKPDEARRLLADARSSAGAALADLRDLVRGIHPPVLADRGLEEAVRALALTVPLPVEITWEPHGARFPAPVESAVYFGVSEAMANIVKHSQASRAWVWARYERELLTIAVEDNGVGGVSVSAGGGLAGIERRLSAFDGILAVSSPPGGPTVVTMEVPCERSSPKISPS
jgi:signal transduction histidine kinase